MSRGRSHFTVQTLLAVTALVGLTGTLHAAMYYVATDGSDANPGTIDRPFRRIQKAVDVVAPGDTIVVRDGVYGPFGSRADQMPVYITSSGTANAPITMRAEHKWAATLDCQLACHSYVNFAAGSAYWILQDFEITAGISAGVWANSNTHDVLVRGNHIHDIGRLNTRTQYGIVGAYTGHAASNLTFDANLIHDIGRTNADIVNHDQGLYIQGSTNVTITNNIFYNMQRGWAVQLSTGPKNVLIANNTFAFANPYRDGQIVFDGDVSNVTIRANIFYRTTGIAVSNAGGNQTNCTIDNNAIHGAAGVTDAAGCRIANNRFFDPGFVNAASAPYDFHLKANSPTVRNTEGVPVTAQDFDGNARSATGDDFGAYSLSNRK
jgi:hypothetical protein